MKILLVSGIYPPDIGGPATFIPGFESYLREQGNEVNVVTLSDNTEKSREMYPGVNFASRKLCFFVRQIVTLYILSRNARKAEVIFSNGLFEECSLIALTHRKKVVFKIVGDPIWERYRNRTSENISIENFNQARLPLRFRVQRHLLRMGLNQGYAICTPSPQLSALIQDWGVRTPITVIPNGVPVFEIPQDVEISFDVITVSRLVKWKNIDTIIRVCKERNLSLGIIGAGPEYSNLKEQALACNARVVFLGELQGAKLNSAIASGRIFTLFSQYEGLSFALISAMMLGKYVVASDIPGNRNAISSGFNGVLVPIHALDLYGESLNAGMSDDKAVTLIREHAREIAVRDFSDVKCYERTTAILRG
jgi:glycosyltransferase involved in cell wall biosynthesis